MPKEVIDAIMARRNPRTGRNYTRDEAEAIYMARAKKAHIKKYGKESYLYRGGIK